MNRTLGEVSKYIPCTLSTGADLNIRISGVSTDSRSITPGQLFVPLIGDTFDGHQYVEESLRKGAVASFWQRGVPGAPEEAALIYVDDTLEALQQLAAAYRQTLDVRVIAVTGSNGKTTTKDMIASILATTYNVVKTEGTLNNHIGLPLTLLKIQDDTECAVIEMGMSGRGEIAMLSELAAPEIAVITNVGDAHMLQLGSRKEIANAKLEVLKGIKPDGLLIYPWEEMLIKDRLAAPEQFVEEVDFPLPKTLKTWSFGETDQSDVYPTSVMKHDLLTHFHLNGISQATFTVPVPGWHNVLNAVAAVAVCRYLGVAEDDLVHGLETVKLSDMRASWVKLESGLTIINDAFNASPTSMRAAIDMFAEIKRYKRKFLVLGDMLELGPNEVQYHEHIGEYITPNHTDYMFTFGKLAENIAIKAKPSLPEGNVRVFQDLQQLSAHLAKLASADDLVLIKGSRGMKLEMVVEYLKASV